MEAGKIKGGSGSNGGVGRVVGGGGAVQVAVVNKLESEEVGGGN